MCGCSITAGLGNKLMDNFKMARETIQHIYKCRVNEASHLQADGNGPALWVSQIRHTHKVQQEYRPAPLRRCRYASCPISGLLIEIKGCLSHTPASANNRKKMREGSTHAVSVNPPHNHKHKGSKNTCKVIIVKSKHGPLVVIRKHRR